MMVIENTITAKTSAAPNARAKLATMGNITRATKVDRMPAVNEA